MAASDHVNPDQLRMFVPAKEIAETWGSTEVAPHEMRDYLDMKLEESEMGSPEHTHGSEADSGPTHYESVRDEGVKEPVFGYKGGVWGDEPALLGQGHHRVAASYDIDPNREIPVTWKS